MKEEEEKRRKKKEEENKKEEKKRKEFEDKLQKEEEQRKDLENKTSKENKILESDLNNELNTMYNKKDRKSPKNKGKTKYPNLPPIKKNEISSYKKIQLKSYSHYKGNQNLMATDNEELIAQIYYSKNEIQQKMREINDLKSKFSLLEDDNKTNKLLMEKLLFKEEETAKTEDNPEEKAENQEEKNEKSPRKKSKDDSKKITLLKNEIKHYDKNLQELEKMIESKKEEEMTKKYIFLSEQTKSKEIELKDLLNSCTELNVQLNRL